MTYPIQQTLQTQLPQALELFERYAFDSAQLQRLAPLITHFEIRLPFIGVFSSGKSSLINALLSERHLLATDIAPETAIATEIRYGDTLRYCGHTAQGDIQELSQADVEESRFGHLLPDGWLSLTLPNAWLSAIPHIVLVDMPGWDSGVQAHQRVVDDYASRSLAYVVVVSAEEGTLRESLRKALTELAIQEKPVILAITKAHKKPAEDVQKVAQAVQEEISRLMGRAPLAVTITSAHKNDSKALQSAIERLEQRALEVFKHSVVLPWRQQLQHAAQLLHVLAQQDFKDAEMIKADIEEFEVKMQAFEQRLQHETQGLEDKVEPILSAIRQRVEAQLSQRVDNLADRALSGGDVGSDILGTARLVVAQAVKEEMAPTIRRYIDKLVDTLPSKLDFQFNLNSLQTSTGRPEDGNGEEFAWKNLAVTLTPLLAVIPHPFAKIAAVVLPLFASLFGGGNKSQARDEERALARQREQAINQVRQALDQAIQQIDAQLRPALLEHVQKAKESVAQNIATERADFERTLNVKRQALEAGEAQAAQQREQAQQQLQRVNNWLKTHV